MTGRPPDAFLDALPDELPGELLGVVHHEPITEAAKIARDELPTTAPKQKYGGLVIVLNAIHHPDWPFGKNGRIVACAVGWHMGRKHEAIVGAQRLMSVTGLGREAVSIALNQMCEPGGPFQKERRGKGRCNRYVIQQNFAQGSKQTKAGRTPKRSGPKRTKTSRGRVTLL